MNIVNSDNIISLDTTWIKIRIEHIATITNQSWTRILIFITRKTLLCKVIKNGKGNMIFSLDNVELKIH